VIGEPDPNEAEPPAPTSAVPVPDAVITPSAIPEPPPTMPGRGALFLAFGAVVIAGLFGAIIGFGLADIQSQGNSGVAVAISTVVGAVIAAVGVGVVAVLTLRAMAEWKSHEPADEG
jgi:hypothetical protein